MFQEHFSLAVSLAVQIVTFYLFILVLCLFGQSTSIYFSLFCERKAAVLRELKHSLGFLFLPRLSNSISSRPVLGLGNFYVISVI